MQKKIMLVFGTRPEAIKMAPLVKEFLRYPEKFETVVCVTGQHREMLDQVLRIFDIQPDYDLNIMKQGQDLYDVTARVLVGMRNVLRKVLPDVVLVHGDTTTSTAAALAAFYQQIPVGHIEAGLRTHDIYSPWPEEMNRQITSRIATYHFSPTPLSKQNLLAEGIKEEQIVVTGNTVIDALYRVVDHIKKNLKLDAELESLLKQAGYDVTRLKEFAEYRKQTFADDRVKGGQKLWEAKPGEERIYKLKSGSEINVVMLQEDISKGQRVEEFSVEAHTADGWKEVGQGTTVGYKRMLRFPAVKTDRLKIKIKNCRLTANISKIAAFYAVPLQEEGETVDWNNLPRSAWKQVSASPLVIDLGSPVSLGAFTYAPAKAEAKPTMAFRYKFFVSLDGNNWKEVPSSGEFSNIMHNPLPQTVSFKEKVKARFIKLEATTPTDTPAVVEINEIGVTVNK